MTKSTIKKWLLVLLKIMLGIVIFLLVGLAIVFTINKFSSHAELKKLEPYGQVVMVDDKPMNVLIQGEGEETIVLLPGFGTASPALDFKLLVDALSPFFQVVVVEPFGYGLSGQTDKERLTANIVQEIHEALQHLNIDRYVLMAHSISGLYSLDYANQYPDEITAFVGLDSSVPTISEQKVDASMTRPVKWFRDLGFARIQVKLEDDSYEGLDYDAHTKEQLKILILKNRFNTTQLNEIESMYDNFLTAQQQAFPVDLPVLLFVQAHHPVIDQWVPEHEKQIKDVSYAKMVLLEADHYLHRTHAQDIVTNVRDFISGIVE